MPRNRSIRRAELVPTGVDEIDRLKDHLDCTIGDYIVGVSAYIRQSAKMGSTAKENAKRKKAAQIRLSNSLARALANELGNRVPTLRGRLVTQEQKVAGALRTANADVSEKHELDGLRVAIELKPINLAVGRAIWNRFGDIRMFAVNIHLKFPFAIVGGVLVIPTYEEIGTPAARAALKEEELEADETIEHVDVAAKNDRAQPRQKSTVHLIDRAIDRLIRAGGRRSEADAAHLLEAIAVVVYDPDSATVVETIPAVGSGLRWNEFIESLVLAYRARFED